MCRAGAGERKSGVVVVEKEYRRGANVHKIRRRLLRRRRNGGEGANERRVDRVMILCCKEKAKRRRGGDGEGVRSEGVTKNSTIQGWKNRRVKANDGRSSRNIRTTAGPHYPAQHHRAQHHLEARGGRVEDRCRSGLIESSAQHHPRTHNHTTAANQGTASNTPTLTK